MITIMSKYQPKYEHDAHHICFDPISRKELKDPVKQAEQKQCHVKNIISPKTHMKSCRDTTHNLLNVKKENI